MTKAPDWGCLIFAQKLRQLRDIAAIRRASSFVIFSGGCELPGMADRLCSAGPLERPVLAIERLGEEACLYAP